MGSPDHGNTITTPRANPYHVLVPVVQRWENIDNTFVEVHSLAKASKLSVSGHKLQCVESGVDGLGAWFRVSGLEFRV